MEVQRFAAFSDGHAGGNPAGIVIGDAHPDAAEMQAVAADVGFSETAFAAPTDGAGHWRVRYFSPESEVPFCGHATIALGAALAEREGRGTYHLHLNEARISVDGAEAGGIYAAALQSPPTWHAVPDPGLLVGALDLMGYSAQDLDAALAPARIHAGADHLLLALGSRSRLAAMDYDLDAGRALMTRHRLVTVMLVWRAGDGVVHVRNAFASGGVLEDPATGAAAAAFAGYLRDSGRAAGGSIDIVQGEDMGMRSLIRAEFSAVHGSSVRVSGTARRLP
ncbi:PhzF family phenazine biosynthesis protein [Hoeflea marina]|uniref:PhzF family phenazine biosynthesis protein n=1 Tax=Hoeflea marina TaxID=274592 RepID=A0A317PK47_9HYPH|nr:PhzF family phenazine biosynthesis protein [Hoeflea marina]PWV98949.1 PhzF family phenazine biosynthesis protein [Hoeflea marina]